MLKKMLNFMLCGLLVFGLVAISGCADKATEEVEETVNDTVDQASNVTEEVSETVYPSIIEAEETAEDLLNKTASVGNETLHETVNETHI